MGKIKYSKIKYSKYKQESQNLSYLEMVIEPDTFDRCIKIEENLTTHYRMLMLDFLMLLIKLYTINIR